MSASDENIFTEHVKTLDRQTTDMPHDVRTKLASRLKKQLRSRGLLKCSAEVFGLSGQYVGEDEAFNELLFESYLHLFYGVGKQAGKQLNFLKMQVNAGNSIDALIQRNLSNFVHDRHQKAFPKSAGIHKNVKAAAQQVVNDQENDVRFVGSGGPNGESKAILGTASSGDNPVEIVSIVRAIRELFVWQATLKIVQRFSDTAVAGTAAGILALFSEGYHPFRLSSLESAIAELAYEPIENARMSSEVEFPDDNGETPEFVRTILDEDSYLIRQAKVDEFVHEGQLAIFGMSFDEITTDRLLEILACYAEKCRHCDPEKNISQTQVAADVGLPKQTMNDYMKKLRAALETIRS